MELDLINDRDLKKYLKKDKILKEKFQYLEKHKSQVILFFEYIGDKDTCIMEILCNESSYKDILKKEFKEDTAQTFTDNVALIARLIELAYNDFKQLEFQ